jgi:hypothetical protein
VCACVCMHVRLIKLRAAAPSFGDRIDDCVDWDLVPSPLKTQTDTPVVDFDITPLGVNLMEVPYVASVLQKMVRPQSRRWIDSMIPPPTRTQSIHSPHPPVPNTDRAQHQ